MDVMNKEKLEQRAKDWYESIPSEDVVRLGFEGILADFFEAELQRRVDEVRKQSVQEMRKERQDQAREHFSLCAVDFYAGYAAALELIQK